MVLSWFWGYSPTLSQQKSIFSCVFLKNVVPLLQIWKSTYLPITEEQIEERAQRAMQLYCLNGFISGKPNDIFGTKTPSITSTCNQSAWLRLIICRSLSKWAKSADNTEGAISFIVLSCFRLQNYIFFDMHKFCIQNSHNSNDYQCIFLRFATCVFFIPHKTKHAFF